MAITKKKFGKYHCENIYAFTLVGKGGLAVEILNYGGIIRKLIYKNVDVVLAHDTMENYKNNPEYFGAVIGRNANCIADSEFDLNGQIYKLNTNSGNVNLHGGFEGFDKKVWDVQIVDREEPSIVLSIISPNGEEGFPGEVNAKVVYTVTNDNSLKIHYIAKSDADTVLNMTNHTYFNLNGHQSGTIDNHSLWLNADFYTPHTEDCIPTGEVLRVKNTPFDFNVEAVLGTKFASEHPQIKMSDGLDHNFALKGHGYRLVGRLKGDKTGINMEIYTDQRGIQIYSGNEINGERVYKDKTVYVKHQGLCLETQAFPNNIKFSHFPNGILKKGEKYDTTTTYKFI